MGISDHHGEGSRCTCASAEEHKRLVMEVDVSFTKDAERARMAPTATMLRRRVEAWHAARTNSGGRLGR